MHLFFVVVFFPRKVDYAGHVFRLALLAFHLVGLGTKLAAVTQRSPSEPPNRSDRKGSQWRRLERLSSLQPIDNSSAPGCMAVILCAFTSCHKTRLLPPPLSRPSRPSEKRLPP